MLLDKVREQLPSADQALIDRTLSQLGKAESDVSTPGAIDAFVKRCLRSVSAVAPVETPTAKPEAPKAQAMRSAAEVQAAAVGAVAGIATVSTVMTTDILLEAKAKMEDALKADYDAAVDAIAKAGVESVRAQIEDLKKFMGCVVQSPLSLAMEEWSGETIEAPAIGQSI